MTVENFLKLLCFGAEVRIIDYDNMDEYRGCALIIPNDYYQREIRTVFSCDCCTCIIIK